MNNQSTVGEDRVRMSFNPSLDDNVSLIKQKTAELINICASFGGLDPRLTALAMTAYEEAAMWAVKAATAPTLNTGNVAGLAPGSTA